MLSDENKWKIELLITRCHGVCEIGKLLQTLWTEYQLCCHEIEDLRERIRDRRGEGR